jgi:DNA-binding MarR family transcriptional regulator
MLDADQLRATQRCAGSAIRRTDRVIMQLYDTMMAPSGLQATQFGLLVTIADAAPLTINRLAEMMDTDRTTLTRNLSVLVKHGWLRIEEGEDRRKRMLHVTPAGDAAIARAWPLWHTAQAHIEAALGRDRLNALLAELAAIRDAAK